MKIYLAAPYAARDSIRATYVPTLRVAGHIVTSSWLDATRMISAGTVNTSTDSSSEEVMYHAGKDLEEVDQAEVLIHFTAAKLLARFPWELSPWRDSLHSGGRHVETGYALALHKSVIVLGEPENIFQRGLCHICPTFDDVLDVLSEMSEDWA